MEHYRKNIKVIFIFLLPTMAVYCIMAVTPIIQSLYFAFFEWEGYQGMPLEFVGIKNIIRMFTYKSFLLSLKNVLQFIVLNLVLQIIIGYGLAFLLSTYLKGFRAFKAVFFFPVVLPMTATALLWKFIYFPNATGVLNNLVALIGIEPQAWLLEPSLALNSVTIANVWTGLGYHMVLGFAAISGIPDDIMEAAELDGVTGIRKTIFITVPLIWEILKVSVVLIVTGSLKNFDIIFVMTEGGPNGLTHVPSTLLYYEAFKFDNYGLGSAISAFIFIVSILLAVLSLRLMQREKIEY